MGQICISINGIKSLAKDKIIPGFRNLFKTLKCLSACKGFIFFLTNWRY